MRWFILPLSPVPWRVGPVYAARSKTSHRIGGGVGRDQEVHSYQEAVRAEMKRQGATMIDGPFKLVLLFWRDMPTYATEKSARARAHEADGTNMYKSTEDALQGILYENDKDNIDGHWSIVEQGPNVTGRVVIGIEPTTKETVTNQIIDMIPDEIYMMIWGTPEQQLQAGLLQGKAEMDEDEPDEYANAPEVF